MHTRVFAIGFSAVLFVVSGVAWAEVDYLPQVDDFSNYLLNSEVGVEAALNARFSLRIVGADKFSSRPAAFRKENDITLISSLVYKY